MFLSVILPDVTRQGKADPDVRRQAQHSNTFPIFIPTSSSYKRRLLPLKSNFDVLSSTRHVLSLGSRHAEVWRVSCITGARHHGLNRLAKQQSGTWGEKKKWHCWKRRTIQIPHCAKRNRAFSQAQHQAECEESDPAAGCGRRILGTARRRLGQSLPSGVIWVPDIHLINHIFYRYYLLSIWMLE